MSGVLTGLEYGIDDVVEHHVARTVARGFFSLMKTIDSTHVAGIQDTDASSWNYLLLSVRS